MTVYVSTGVHPYVVKAETRDGSSRSSAVFTDVGLPPKVSAPPSSATVDAGDLGSDDGMALPRLTRRAAAGTTGVGDSG